MSMSAPVTVMAVDAEVDLVPCRSPAPDVRPKSLPFAKSAAEGEGYVEKDSHGFVDGVRILTVLLFDEAETS